MSYTRLMVDRSWPPNTAVDFPLGLSLLPQTQVSPMSLRKASHACTRCNPQSSKEICLHRNIHMDCLL